jgi:hypothetical protein
MQLSVQLHTRRLFRVINKHINYFSSVSLQNFLAWKSENKLLVFVNELLGKILGQQECEVSWQLKAPTTGNCQQLLLG